MPQGEKLPYGHPALIPGRLRWKDREPEVPKDHCAYCGRRLKPRSELTEEDWRVRPAVAAIPTVDHVVPKCKGGSNYPENRVLACHDCNMWKGKLDLDEFTAMLQARWVSLDSRRRIG